MPSIPVIDISPLCNTGCNTVDQETKDQVIQQIHQACKDFGFFYLTGHGIEQSTMNQIFNATKSFFALPMEKKTPISTHNSPSYTGYAEIRAEKTLNAADMREGFYFYPGLSTNQFPEENDLPGFADVVTSYTEQVRQLGLVTMGALAVGLGLPNDHFDEMFSAPTQSSLFLLHYPPYPADTESWGVGPHTDYGICTILLQDDIGGLEVEITEGQWIEAKPIPGTVVVNLGDSLQGWTKGLYKAMKHRVRRSINTDRYSVPFFFGPKAECLIEPIETDVTKSLTYTKVVKGMEMPFQYGDLLKSLLHQLQTSQDWGKDVLPNAKAKV